MWHLGSGRLIRRAFTQWPQGQRCLHASSRHSLRLRSIERCSRHPAHCSAAAATWILCQSSTHERLSGDFYFAEAFRIGTPVTFVASHAVTVF